MKISLRQSFKNWKLKHKGKGMKACFQSPTKHEAKPKQACLISVTCRLAKCRSDWKEQEARSQTMMCLHNHCSLSFAKVPKRLKGARSTKPNRYKLEHSLRSHHTSQTNKLTNRSKLRLFLLCVCLQSVTCRLAKCQLNEVKMKISLRQNYLK